ncbi:hypothetical protein [Propionispora sp. 2/2-37]|uniref:hypothetical protein n=1 Tax=Propionispora sp. 2/2-37 TaxID=1677858 RepID=UPI0012E20BAD|nr:hypothetical protein [Propionispora sp. 2/2-37]
MIQFERQLFFDAVNSPRVAGAEAPAGIQYGMKVAGRERGRVTEGARLVTNSQVKKP